MTSIDTGKGEERASNGRPNWRVGLLATTLVMGAALTLSGIDRYRTSVRAARAVAEAEAASVMGALRREIGRGRAAGTGNVTLDEEALDAVFEDLARLGVTYVAVIGANGDAIVERGAARYPVAMPSHGPHADERFAEPRVIRSDEDVVHAVAPVGRFGAGRRGGQRPVIVAELRPKTGAKLIGSARRALIMEIGAAGLLILAAAVFWRMSTRAQRMALEMELERHRAARELERDRQLKALGQMSAVLGHELRNPLAALKGHAQLLAEDRSADERARPRVERIVAEIVQLEKLVAQVLDFARTGAIEPRRVYLDDLVASAVALADADPVEVVASVDAAPWLLDRGWMERVLVNLLRNAREASGPGAPVELRVEAKAALRIEIADRGPGIATGDEERIFEPFFTGKARGTGLGLALARRIVAAHGGTISARNDPAGGAVFTVSIPKDEREA